MTKNQARVLKLIEEDGLTYLEASKVMGVHKSRINQLYHQAKYRLENPPRTQVEGFMTSALRRNNLFTDKDIREAIRSGRVWFMPRMGEAVIRALCKKYGCTFKRKPSNPRQPLSNP